MEKRHDLGLIGLGVMGKSLARNFASKGLSVSVYNLPLPGEQDVVRSFVEKYGHENLSGCKNIRELVASLTAPRVVLLMVKSGPPVDDVIDLILKELEPGDIIIDGGNSHFKDSIRRYEKLKEESIEFVGMGVSGGEAGALKGPSIMPSGSTKAMKRLMPMLTKIAAIAGGKPCVAWLGNDGAGHFVKMVHNGIEYADMQILAESYAALKGLMGMDNPGIAVLFEEWNNSIAGSFLLEISVDILKYQEDGAYVLDQILDVAESKGTGLWTLQEALALGVPIPTINAAVNERLISDKKFLRTGLGAVSEVDQSEAGFDISNLLGAMIFSRLVALAEGFHLIAVASKKYGWQIDLATLGQVWSGGCIIRSRILEELTEAFKEQPESDHLFSSKRISKLLKKYLPDAETMVSAASKTTISIPGISASLQYFKSMHSENLPHNLIQAQRDYFGAHQYKKKGSEGQSYHTDWKK